MEDICTLDDDGLKQDIKKGFMIHCDVVAAANERADERDDDAIRCNHCLVVLSMLSLVAAKGRALLEHWTRYRTERSVQEAPDPPDAREIRGDGALVRADAMRCELRPQLEVRKEPASQCGAEMVDDQADRGDVVSELCRQISKAVGPHETTQDHGECEKRGHSHSVHSVRWRKVQCFHELLHLRNGEAETVQCSVVVQRRDIRTLTALRCCWSNIAQWEEAAVERRRRKEDKGGRSQHRHQHLLVVLHSCGYNQRIRHSWRREVDAESSCAV